MLRRWNLRGYEVRLDETGPSQEVFAESDIACASHLITRRGAYRHHGVYVGDGRVIQYTGYSSGIRRRPVEEVSLGVFAGGHSVRVLHRGAGRYSPVEVIERARSRLGEDRYRILTNNCEHFCEWCFSGVARSFQVEAMRHVLLRMVLRQVLAARAPGAPGVAKTF